MTVEIKHINRAGLVVRFMAGFIVCGLASCVAVAPAAASADESLYPQQIAALAADAAPDNATPVAGVVRGDGFELSAGIAEVTVPMDGANPVGVSASVSGKDLVAEISLPAASSLEEGVLTSNGTVVYTDDSHHASVAVQTLSNGDTRVQTIIRDSRAEHEFGYEMPGYQAIRNADGTAAFVADSAEGAYIPVEKPWAVDANGKDVETYYEVRGTKLFQVVVADETTVYPVVADPTWGWRNAAWGVTLSRSETASIKDYAAASAFCAALVKNQKLTIACGVWSGYLQVQAATANRLKPKGCLHIVVVPLPGAITHTHC